MDCSEDIINDLLLTPFDSIFDSVDKIKTALESPLLCRIPIAKNRNHSFATNPIFEIVEDSSKSCEMVVNVLNAFEYNCASLTDLTISEENVLIASTTVTGAMWSKMFRLLRDRGGKRLTFILNKKDRSKSTIGASRPDECIYIDTFLIGKGEHKDEELGRAIAELTNKLSDWNKHDFGRISYMPVYASARSTIEFGLVDLRLKAYHRVRSFDLSNAGERVACMKMSINILRLFNSMIPLMPTVSCPLYKTIDHITFYPGYVLKDTAGKCTAPRELYEILCTGQLRCAVTYTTYKSIANKWIIKPVGFRIADSGSVDSKDIKEAIHCVCKCLADLHKFGFVHRDIRWSNIIQIPKATGSGYTFVVIDFDYGDIINAPMNIEGYIFDDVVKYGDQFTQYHDMVLVSILLKKWIEYSSARELSDLGKDFMNKVPHTAAAALNHEWFN